MYEYRPGSSRAMIRTGFSFCNGLHFFCRVNSHFEMSLSFVSTRMNFAFTLKLRTLSHITAVCNVSLLSIIDFLYSEAADYPKELSQ